MKSIVLVLCVVLFAVISNGQPSNRSLQQRTSVSPLLPIRRVVLYSNGVAYVERRGVVTGNVELNLSFKLSQIDDVLKSLIVLDMGQGRIGAVSYNSSEPASSRMSEIPFSVAPISSDGQGISAV